MRFHDRIFEIFNDCSAQKTFRVPVSGWRSCAKAMLRMGGSIRAQSAPGEGATFYLELPR